MREFSCFCLFVTVIFIYPIAQNLMIPSPILPQFFYARTAFSMGRSKYRSNEARGPIVRVESSNDVPREQLHVQSSKMV